MNSIEVKNLSVSYDTKRVLIDNNVNIESGNVYCVVGPNGAGKSTLFKSILGLIDTDHGDIKVMGGDIDKVRKKVAYVPQRDDVDWTFPATVKDIVLMGRYPHKTIFQRMKAEDHNICKTAMEKVGMLDFQNRQIGALSGGQQQRVFIARALAQDADIFFLDEPFVGVDIMTEERIIEILKNLAAEGKTILVVHHDLSTVKAYFDKVILLNREIIAYGDVETTFTKKNIAAAYGQQFTIMI